MNATQALTQTTPPQPGQYWEAQGGTYAGIMRGAPGKPAYHLIVATGPKGVATLKWGPQEMIPGADCEWDGEANTAAIIASGLDCPAAQHSRTLAIEGHTDFYLPSRRELALCYATTLNLFEPFFHFSSTQFSEDNAWLQYFSYGGQILTNKSFEARCRFVRRLILQPFNPLAGEA